MIVRLTSRAVNCAATGNTSAWKFWTIVSILWLRTSNSVSSQSFKRSDGKHDQYHFEQSNGKLLTLKDFFDLGRNCRSNYPGISVKTLGCKNRNTNPNHER